jgi:hypothetical protein
VTYSSTTTGWGLPANTVVGAEMGGGAGDDGLANNSGGSGGIVVEWFYD